MKHLIEEAFLNAILTEKKSYDFYRTMAETMHDNSLRTLFHQMADDEADHMRSFVMRYPGDEFDLLAMVNSKALTTKREQKGFSSPPHNDLEGSQALEISLFEELECLNYYSTLVTCINEPEFRSVFEFALQGNRRHYGQICDEYLKINGNNPSCLPHLRYISDNSFPAAMPSG